jgi:hypothetical protein
LGEIDKRYQLVHEEELKLTQVQADLEAELREGEADYKASSPFRILYDPEPETMVDLASATANMRFQIAVEPTSLKALKVRLDNLAKLNKSFVSIYKAYEDLNKVMNTRFAQVADAMNAVKDAMAKANTAGSSYGAAVVSVSSREWNVPPGKTVSGTVRKTSWSVDYPRSFNLTVSLLVVRDENDANIIEHKSLSLVSDISQNGLLKPDSAFFRGSFKTVNIAGIGESGVPVVRVETVNGIDANTAMLKDCIEIIRDGARTASVVKWAAAREARRESWQNTLTVWRNYFSDNNHFTSLGVAVGTTFPYPPSSFITPAVLVSPKLTFSPFSHFFLDSGADFGLAGSQLWDCG